MSYSDKVLEFATKAHEGQVRKYTGVPYITHPIEVARLALPIARIKLEPLSFLKLDFVEITEIIKSISFLHDVAEDTSVSLSDIYNFLEGIGVSGTNVFIIIDAVKSLTKSKKYFNLFTYLDEIKKNNYALIVKLADLEHNMSDLKDQKKLDHYRLIKYYLEH